MQISVISLIDIYYIFTLLNLSRSFGFSQGHRQMTRHVQLLLLIVGAAANGAKEDAKYEPTEFI